MCLLILRKLAETRCPMKIETGSLIFAALNCLFLFVISFLGLILSLVLVLKWDGLDELMEFFELSHCQAFVFTLLMSAASFLALGFAFTLNKGLLQRDALHVKIYFYYGVIVTIVSLCALIPLRMVLKMPDDISHLIIVGVLIVLCVYVLILIMIRDTYKKFEIEAEDDEEERRIFVVSQTVQMLNKRNKNIFTGILRPKIDRI